MFTTVVAVISVLVLVLPGFVVADLQRRKRASVAAASDWELVLRALFYSLILHLAVSPWTRCVVLKIEEGDWYDHLNALIVYGVVVLVLAPAAAGLALNAVLLQAEQSGPLRWWHYALGGRDARQAWDFIFQRLDTGRWLVVKMKSGPTIAGKLGTDSWVSQSPAQSGHDLWLEEIWTVDDYGRPGNMVEPRQGMWVARDDIDALFVIDPPGA
jgi:Family of unknown function (DUF6338)